MNKPNYKFNDTPFSKEELQHAEDVMALDIDENFNVVSPSVADPCLVAERLSIAKWQRPNAYDDSDYIYCLMTGNVNPLYIGVYNQFIVDNVTNEFASGSYIGGKIEEYRLLYENICEQINHYKSMKIVPNLFEYFYDYLYTATCLSYEFAFEDQNMDCHNKRYQRDKQVFMDSVTFHTNFFDQAKHKKELNVLSDISQNLQAIIDYMTNKATQYGQFFSAYNRGDLAEKITFEEFASKLPKSTTKFVI